MYWARPPPGSFTLSSRKTDLDAPPLRHLPPLVQSRRRLTVVTLRLQLTGHPTTATLEARETSGGESSAGESDGHPHEVHLFTDNLADLMIPEPGDRVASDEKLAIGRPVCWTTAKVCRSTPPLIFSAASLIICGYDHP